MSSVFRSAAYSADAAPEGGNEPRPDITAPATKDANVITAVDGSYSIGTITILPANVFDLSNPDEDTLIGRVGDILHVVTMEGTIRNELLFKEGDPYDKELIEETERNIRLRTYLTEVQIVTKPNPVTKTVDVTVKTKDHWTLIIGGTVGGTNQNGVVGLDVGEKNLAGLGQTLSYSYRHDNTGASNSAAFSDPNLAGTRYALGLSYLQTPMEIDKSVSFQRPFYSLETESSHGISYSSKAHFEPTLNYNSYRLVAFYGLAYFFYDEILRPSVALSIGEQNVLYPTVPSTATRDNKIELTLAALEEPRNFAKDSYIQSVRQTEDIPLGAQYTYLVGQALETLGSTTTETSLSFQATKWTRLFERDYLYGALSLAVNDDNFNKQLADLQAQYFFRRFLLHTLFFNFHASYLDSDSNRFYLGATTGLRGYPVNQFVGRNLILINLEDRIYTYQSMLFGIIEPGFVLFLDSGDAWNNFTGDTFHGLYSDVGAGLRFGILKAPGISLVRIDYGVPLGYKGAPVISLGVSGTF
ncbi:MAG: hypothetical protein HY098_03360 [Nitrospinae bacterium]|nr:hypothetical protein [Nitrospinota bacterium]